LIDQVLSYIGYFILFINSILYFKTNFYQKECLKVFSSYLFLMSIIQIISFVLWKLFITNLFLSHFYFVLQFILLSLFYNKILEKPLQKKRVLVIMKINLVLIFITYLIEPSLFYQFNIYEIILTSVPLVYYSLLYFFNSLSKKINYLYINLSVLFYVLLSMLIFVSGNNIIILPDFINDITWVLNSIFYIIFQLLIFYEWYKNLRHKKVLEIN